MPFEVHADEDRWFVRKGPISFGPFPTREKAAASAGALNAQTAGGSRPPFVGAAATLATRGAA